jgi:hypothetical protein
MPGLDVAAPSSFPLRLGGALLEAEVKQEHRYCELFAISRCEPLASLLRTGRKRTGFDREEGGTPCTFRTDS